MCEDREPRRTYVRRNPEEALTCPFCQDAFFSLATHIQSNHSEEPKYAQEIHTAKWRERLLKVNLAGSNDAGDSHTECGKVGLGICLLFCWVSLFLFLYKFFCLFVCFFVSFCLFPFPFLVGLRQSFLTMDLCLFGAFCCG